MKKISILGAGWLGLSLAKELQSHGYDVLGTYRSSGRKVELFELNIPSVYANLDTDTLPEEIFMSDVLCVFIPPSKSEDYMANMEKILKHPGINRIKQIIFTSSISVYANTAEPKTEKSPLDENNQVAQAEKLFLQNPHTCILRLAGLMGEDRYLAKYYKKEVPKALTVVNHVHKEDVIAILLKAIETETKGVFNVCAPLHPTREDIITHQCNTLLLTQPDYEQKASRKGIISTKKLEETLAYMYKHPNPIYFPLIKNQDVI